MHTAEGIGVVNSCKIQITGMSRKKLVSKKHFHIALYSLTSWKYLQHLYWLLVSKPKVHVHYLMDCTLIKNKSN